MKTLILERKTGFFSSVPFTIYEPNENVFYSSEFVNKISEGKTHFFNLPAGRYYYTGSINILPHPVKHKEIKLPSKERNIPQKRYKIIFGNNPSKCTIYYKRGIILFDESFKSAPLYIKYAIYFHELGHHFYQSEKFADLYAAKKMLEYGFNVSQIGRTSLFALSSENMERKEFIINTLLQ